MTGFAVDNSDGVRMVRTPAAGIRPTPTSPVDWGKRFVMNPIPWLESGPYGQPLYTTTDPAKVWSQRVFPRSGYAEYGHLDPIPDIVRLPQGFAPSSGTDNQADHAWPGGVDSVWGYMNYWTAPMTRFLFWVFRGEWGRQKVYNALRGMTDSDAVAGSVGHFVRDQQGNGGFYAPSLPTWMVTPTADEVEAGLIPHAIGLTMTMTMGGPIAPRTILDVDHPDIGVKYKAACAPAMLIENGPWGNDPTKGIMMGQRFRLNWTDQQLYNWVGGKAPAYRAAAQTFGRALIDFGVIPTQSGDHNLFPLDSTQAARYTKAGVVPNLLDGIDWGAMIALDPPTAQYRDGSTGNREGDIKSFGY